MRGNLENVSVQVHREGSIPAHAGEPETRDGRVLVHWVYPRACGGTQEIYGAECPGSGLSPRMRGNLENVSVQVHREGSIPAHAGEPYAKAAISVYREVYPRACGGTFATVYETL